MPLHKMCDYILVVLYVLGGSGGYTVAELLCKSRRNAKKQHEPQHPEVSTAVACEVFSVRTFMCV